MRARVRRIIRVGLAAALGVAVFASVTALALAASPP